jgi:hypothetical protein
MGVFFAAVTLVPKIMNHTVTFDDIKNAAGYVGLGLVAKDHDMTGGSRGDAPSTPPAS